MPTQNVDEAGGDRRGSDRRKAHAANLPFSDRRTHQRRSGLDRRTQPRAD